MNNSNNNIFKFLTVLLLISNIVFAWMYFNKKTEQIQTQNELINTDKEKKQLDDLLRVAERTRDSYKGKNAELDSILDARNTELRSKAEELRRALQDKNITQAQKDAVQQELDALRYYVRKYSEQVDSVARANKILVAANDSLQRDLQTTLGKYSQEKNKAAVLQVKVDAASKLKAEGITVTALQKKSSGSYRETSRAKRTNAIKVQMTLGENDVATKNEKEFYLRVIAPDGQTISDALSGGTFTYQGDEFKFTKRVPLVFSNTNQKLEFMHEQLSDWKEGTYTIEIYCEGFMIGKTNFKLD